MTVVETSFAPAERSSKSVVRGQAELFGADDFFEQLLNSVPTIIMVLNSQRQLVVGNRALLDFLSLPADTDLSGQRPGEIFHCRHANKCKGGCGTTEFCRYCGAVNAVLESQRAGHSVAECRILASVNGNEEAFDFRVWTSQFVTHQESFTFAAIVDISDEKRRLFLERIFLHDIANTCNALMGFSSLADGADVTEEKKTQFIERIKLLSRRIADEIKAHQQLIAAEYNQLKLNLEQVDSQQFFAEMLAVHAAVDILNGRLMRIDEKSESLIFTTDRTLLNRVIGNMIKNALEGSVPGETVTMGCYKIDQQIYLWVHNPTYIPENIRMQIFNRSFSTKGAGRGLGTYSMKYFTEKYLQGSINFISKENSGSIFTACYPLTLL